MASIWCWLFVLLLPSEIRGTGIDTVNTLMTSVNASMNQTRILRRVRKEAAEPGDKKEEKRKIVHNLTEQVDDNYCKVLHACDKTKQEKEDTLKQNCQVEYLPEPEGDEGDELKLCYDSDPVPAEPGFIATIVPKLRTSVVSTKAPLNQNDGFPGVGFGIPTKDVYRHAKDMDIYGVKDNYEDAEGPLEIEFIDWPGPTINVHLKNQMEKQTISEVNRELGIVKECLQLLEFEGRSDKFLDYLCNGDEGLDILAVGLIPREEADDTSVGCNTALVDDILLEERIIEPNCTDSSPYYDFKYNLMCNLPKNRDQADSECTQWPVPSGKMYLAYGDLGLLKNFVQPLHVPEDVLRKLVQQVNISLGGRDSIPHFDGERIACTSQYSRDIRTVLDFTFSSNRIILGMKCGVILIKNINQEELEYDVAYLKIADRKRPTIEEVKSHLFPYMINTVAATPCCSTDKMCRHFKPIVAIYSAYAAYKSYPDSVGGDNIFKTMPKFIYISNDNGDTFDRRVVASKESGLNLIYWMFAKIPKWEIKDARPPQWVKNQVWNDTVEKLDEDFEDPVDPITRYVMQDIMPTNTNDQCYEIVSMVAVNEESLLLVLCREQYPGDGVKPPGKPHTYSVFSIQIRGSIPIISTVRRSKRKFKCTPVQVERYWGKDLKVYEIEPTLIRVPNSYSILITGCEKVLFFSNNGGRSIFMSSFYASKSNGTSNQTEYVRTFINDNLKQVPIITLDPQGQNIIMTHSKYFAYGVIPANTEISFVTGSVLTHSKIDNMDDLKATFIPFLNDAGNVGVGVIYVNLVKNLGRNLYKDNYKKRLAIRLMDCHISVHDTALPYYSERVNKVARTSKLFFPPCTTYNFKINVTTINLDVGESAVVHVSVGDSRKDTPLNIILTHDKAASLIVTRVEVKESSSENNLLLEHAWNIQVTAKPYIIERILARSDAFYGASYSNMEEVTAHLLISAEPQMRCHVQPRGHVHVRFGCSKKLVIHEDERRPQCDKFKKNFQYEIPQGHYDPDMAAYWILERPKFYKIVDGTLKITYDYEMFGCPVQPYRLEKYFPDLRVLPVDAGSNSTEGELFKGRFVLVEIFGASGYSFTRKVRDAGCQNSQQTLEKMVQEWKVRVEAIKSVWHNYPHFDFESVYHPLNIWNRVNYEDCVKSQYLNEVDKLSEGDDDAEEPEEEEEEEGGGTSLMDDELDSPYETLVRTGDEKTENRLEWNPTTRQKVYIFMAVAIDPYGTFCNHHVFFGLSITVAKEEPDWIVMLIYFISLFLLLFLVIAGYYLRKHQVYKRFYKEAMFNHLLTAAWNLSFRYEKMLYDAKVTDPDVRKEMEDTRQMKIAHSGVQPPANRTNKAPLKGVDGLRRRLRQ